MSFFHYVYDMYLLEVKVAAGQVHFMIIRGGNIPIPTKLGRSNQNTVFRDGTTLDCQLNPIYPQLVTGSQSGKLRWYTECII